jgi:hypothetical protein
VEESGPAANWLTGLTSTPAADAPSEPWLSTMPLAPPKVYQSKGARQLLRECETEALCECDNDGKGDVDVDKDGMTEKPIVSGGVVDGVCVTERPVVGEGEEDGERNSDGDGDGDDESDGGGEGETEAVAEGGKSITTRP